MLRQALTRSPLPRQLPPPTLPVPSATPILLMDRTGRRGQQAARGGLQRWLEARAAAAVGSWRKVEMEWLR